MSETRATRGTQYGQEQDDDKLPEPGEQIGWLDIKTGTLPAPSRPSWAAPVGLPIPLPPPVTPPSGSELSPTSLAGELTSLPLGWHTLHSEQFGMGGSGFDHIVIGPAGVFTVTTTGHPEGRISIGQHIRNSQFQAARATRLLDQAGLVDISVHPAIVFVGAELTLHDDSSVILTAVDNICRTVLSLPTTLTPLQVQSVYNIAERRETWIERVQPKG